MVWDHCRRSSHPSNVNQDCIQDQLQESGLGDGCNPGNGLQGWKIPIWSARDRGARRPGLGCRNLNTHWQCCHHATQCYKVPQVCETTTSEVQNHSIESSEIHFFSWYRYSRCSLVEALEVASLHPARALGIEKRKGTLDVGPPKYRSLLTAHQRSGPMLTSSFWNQTALMSARRGLLDNVSTNEILQKDRTTFNFNTLYSRLFSGNKVY